MAPHSSTLAWKIPWTEEPGRLQSIGSLRVGHDWATSLSLFHFYALEKEVATHSSVLAWRVPGMGEPGELPSLGSHRVGHDWSDLGAAAAAVEDNFLEEYMRLYFLLSPMLFTKMANGLIGSLCDCNQLVRAQCEHSKDCSPWAWNDPELNPCWILRCH